jgi:predicted AAA+ superfamily ATPase
MYTSNMQGYIERKISAEVRLGLENNPAVAILGPRQCGKTTLAKHITQEFSQAVYLDLEHPADLAKLDDPVS